VRARCIENDARDALQNQFVTSVSAHCSGRNPRRGSPGRNRSLPLSAAFESLVSLDVGLAVQRHPITASITWTIRTLMMTAAGNVIA
jgi:hypothetical protein